MGCRRGLYLLEEWVDEVPGLQMLTCSVTGILVC